MKKKKFKFKDQTVENIKETKLDNVHILEEVGKLPEYDELIAMVPEEDHPKLQETLLQMSEPWQDVYDHITTILADPKLQADFKKKCLERDWRRKDKPVPDNPLKKDK